MNAIKKFFEVLKRAIKPDKTCEDWREQRENAIINIISIVITGAILIGAVYLLYIFIGALYNLIVQAVLQVWATWQGKLLIIVIGVFLALFVFGLLQSGLYHASKKLGLISFNNENEPETTQEILSEVVFDVKNELDDILELKPYTRASDLIPAENSYYQVDDVVIYRIEMMKKKPENYDCDKIQVIFENMIKKKQKNKELPPLFSGTYYYKTKLCPPILDYISYFTPINKQGGIKIAKNNGSMAVLKKYRDDYFRIVIFKSWSDIDVEDVDKRKNKGNRKGIKKTRNKEKKLQENLSRAKSMIFQLALCNDWEYFATLTLDKEKIKDRTDLISFKTKLSKWLNNYNYKKDTHIKYLIIPETHKDGKSWHAHGLFMGVPIEHLTEFTLDDKLPAKTLSLIANGRKLYNWEAYTKSFGYVTMERVINLEAVSKYVTKYITKEIMQTKIKLKEHIYYCSHELNRAQEIYRSELTKSVEPDFENDFVEIKNCRSFDEAIKYFTDDF